jgi:hypothetical protein
MIFTGVTPHGGKECRMQTSDNHEHQHRGSSSPIQEYDKDSEDRSSHRKSGDATPNPGKGVTSDLPDQGSADQSDTTGK